MRLYQKILAVTTTVTLSLFGFTVEAKTILLVPQDDRPVSLSYTVSTAEKAGYTILTPPKSILSGKRFHGQTEAIWQWVENHISQADACVLSTDTLIYGGLVDSRKHNDPLPLLLTREERIRALHESHPNIPIYAFGTVMRTPYASDSGVEPYYYANFGYDIYRISILQDKMDLGTATEQEAADLLSLKLSVPSEYLQDWFKRRTKNNIINRNLMEYAKKGVFTYFCEGHDDNSKNSQTVMEVRYLEKESSRLPRKIYGSFPGADQLALLLIARYHVDSQGLSPSFAAMYPLGRAEDTVPSYENQPIGDTIAQHVEAVGGHMVKKGIPDIMLAVNTPLASTGESAQFSNFGMLKPSTRRFVDQIEETVERGIPVSMVDVYFANGSDNTLMDLMKKKNLLYRITAYNGWNTASNTIGYAVAQAILAPNMSPTSRKEMLTEQYIDNWAYQANVRNKMKRDVIDRPITKDDEEEMIAQVQHFIKKEAGLNPRQVSARFPWNRLFEIEAFIAPGPTYPLYLTRLEKQEIAREKARKEAEAKKKAEEEAKKNAEQEAKNKAKEKATPSPIPETDATSGEEAISSVTIHDE